MRKVQLRQMRQRKTVWVLGALALLALGALWWWASQRPPSIVIPPRQYPPNNAYDAYKQIAQGISDLFATDARLHDIEFRLFRGGAPVSDAENGTSCRRCSLFWRRTAGIQSSPAWRSTSMT
jgi:hypothetical protein